MKKSFLTIALASACALLPLASPVQAHTITFGFENAGPGSVTFWFGSYHFNGQGDGPDLEGALNLVGINGNPYASTSHVFTTSATSQPAGLVNNVTNFYDTAYGSSAFGDVNSWEGVTYSGLTAGDYHFSYIPDANSSAHWFPWSGNQGSDFTLSSAVVNGVPDAASTSVLLAGSLAATFGLGAFSRRRKTVR